MRSNRNHSAEQTAIYLDRLRYDIAIVGRVLARMLSGETADDIVLWDREVMLWMSLSAAKQKRSLRGTG